MVREGGRGVSSDLEGWLWAVVRLAVGGRMGGQQGGGGASKARDESWRWAR